MAFPATDERVVTAMVVLSAACTLAALTGCFSIGLAQGEAEHMETRVPALDGIDSAAAAREGESAQARPLLASLTAQQTSVPLERRIVVYSSGYRIVVQEVDQAMEDMEQIAGSFEGYVQLVDGDTITIRVPVARYQEAVKRVESLGNVVHRKMEATDVTEEYVDLEARLRNATAVRARLEALLTKADDVKAALEVEKELKRLGEEIERLEAKLELIKNRVAFSSISVTFERVARSAGLIRATRLPFDWLRELDPYRLLRTR
ncbi:MAG: DUF4349 domain-containing protein [Phycisphaerales bacterium]|nr:MAG: DUF4349 domain-containing protein [Phycisphaerales bacterium]